MQSTVIDDNVFINSLIMGYCFNPGTVSLFVCSTLRSRIHMYSIRAFPWDCLSPRTTYCILCPNCSANNTVLSASMEHSVHLVQLRQRKPSLMGVDGVSIVSALVDHHVLLEITFGKAMPYI